MPISSFASRTHTTHPPNYSRPIPTDPMDRHNVPALDFPQTKFGAFWAASPAVRPWTRREPVLPPSRRVTNATVAGDGGHRNQNMSGLVAFAEGCCLTGHDHAVKPDTCPTAAAVQEEVVGEGIDGDSEHRSRG